MTKIIDAPLRSSVPSGGYVIVTEPVAAGSPLSTFAKVLPGAIGGGGGAITSAGMAAWFATLPTSPPPGSMQPWNNGGTLSFTF